MLTLDAGDPLAAAITAAIQSGNLDELRRLLFDRPELATATIVRRGRCGEQSRSLLHIATDYPGHFPTPRTPCASSSPRAPTSTPRSPVHTARRRFTGRPAATTSSSSTRCSTPTARSSTAAPPGRRRRLRSVERCPPTARPRSDPKPLASRSPGTDPPRRGTRRRARTTHRRRDHEPLLVHMPRRPAPDRGVPPRPRRRHQLDRARQPHPLDAAARSDAHHLADWLEARGGKSAAQLR
jgi:hypothetical protein